MAAYFIDSNVFFYAKVQDKEYGPACSSIIEGIAGGKIDSLTSVLAIIEVANALRKYGLAEEVKDEVDAIFSLGSPIYEIQSPDVNEAMRIFNEYRLSPYDCLHAAIMKRASTQDIVSADRDFDGIPWLRRIDPKSFKSQRQRC